MAGAPGRGGEAARPIIVKRIKKADHGHHGGAWKIAYADFVTAMMAFFLLMWLLGSTTKGDLNGIAEYFKTPLQVAFGGGSGSGDSSSIVTGGGRDITRKDGQVKNGETDAMKKSYSIKEAEAIREREERIKLEGLKAKIDAKIESDSALSAYKNQIKVDITSEGLRIQIVDDKNRPMFELASARLAPYTRKILIDLTETLNDVPNAISIAGHTDAHQYSGGERGYSNWDLSADRANAARRVMVEGGIADNKILRVVALGSTNLYNESDPLDPMNRRISVVVLNRKAENAVRHDLPAIVSDADDIKATVERVPPAGIRPRELEPVKAVVPRKPSALEN